MKSIWQDQDRQAISDRVGRARVGSLGGVGQVHRAEDDLSSRRQSEDGDGRPAGGPKQLPIRYPPLKQFIIYCRAVSEGRADRAGAARPRAARVERTTSPTCRRCWRAPDRRARTDTWPEHPAFGKLSKRAWGVLIYRHMDHHLKAILEPELSLECMDDKRAFLRHTVATVAYRGGKAVRGAPASFATSAATDRTHPAKILAHIGDLYDWALTQAKGAEAWNNSTPLRGTARSSGSSRRCSASTTISRRTRRSRRRRSSSSRARSPTR